jgi:hypothetical protein
MPSPANPAPVDRRKTRTEEAWRKEHGVAKARSHTSDQIMNLLRQIEVGISNGKTEPATKRKAGITEQTYDLCTGRTAA